MNEWFSLNDHIPPAHALVIYYVPKGRYVWGVGSEVSHVKENYPEVTHWKLITREPDSEQI